MVIAAAAHEVDLPLSVGGGSTTGLAKAIALTSQIPIVAVPTTYAGSEATSVRGLTEGARKTTGVDPRVLPRSVVYDAALTLTLPVAMSAPPTDHRAPSPSPAPSSGEAPAK